MDGETRARLTADMVRLADGDRSAFGPVFESLWPAVRSFCAKVLGSTSDGDADDAAQNAMEKLFARASTFDRERDGLTWALTLAAWECRTVRRRRQRRKEAGLDDAAAIPEARRSPEQETSDLEEERSLREALSMIPAADQETIRRTLEGEGPPADATATTFRKRRERAFDRLREAWRRLHGSI